MFLNAIALGVEAVVAQHAALSIRRGWTWLQSQEVAFDADVLSCNSADEPPAFPGRPVHHLIDQCLETVGEVLAFRVRLVVELADLGVIFLFNDRLVRGAFASGARLTGAGVHADSRRNRSAVIIPVRRARRGRLFV